MIDLTRERLISLSEAAGLLPNRPSTASLWRWRIKGVRGRKLESVLLGGKVYTSIEAMQRFAQQQGDADGQKIRSPAKRAREIERAETDLKRAGI